MFARIAVALGLAVAIFALVTQGQTTSAQTVPSPNSPAGAGISVLGSGIVLATPNTAHITIGVEVNDASLANAQAEAARRMDAVVARLKADGIADDNIRTTSYNVNPQYDQNGALRSYQVQNLVDVKTTNVTGLGPLIDDAVNAGATRVYGIRFEASNMDELKNQARDQAMQNARAKAEQLARNGGVSLGRPITIEESDAGTTPVAARAPAPAAAFSAAPPTPIQPGELSVQTQVRVVYAIQ